MPRVFRLGLEKSTIFFARGQSKSWRYFGSVECEIWVVSEPEDTGDNDKSNGARIFIGRKLPGRTAGMGIDGTLGFENYFEGLIVFESFDTCVVDI